MQAEWEYVERAHRDYMWALLGFWAIVLMIGMVNRVFALIVQTFGRTPGKTEAISERQVQSSKSSLGRVRRLVRQHITYPAIFGYRHSVPWGWCTVPTRIQSFLVFSFVGLNIILCSIRYRALSPSL